MKNACRMGVVVLFMSLGTSGILFAQSDLGRISGFIKDPSGATIANAKVTVQNKSGVERQTATNDSGYYVITNVPPGLYTMVAQAAGFQKYETTNNKLDPSADLVIDATLSVGAASQTVEVSASAVLLQTESAAVQKDVTREQIDALELNGRNPIFMANLVPGTRGGNIAGLSFNFTQGPSNINGSRNPENLITYDGAPATRTRSNGTSLGSADLDSTQEIQILTADYAAEYGRTSGGRFESSRKVDRPISTVRLTNTYATRLSTPIPGRAIILWVKTLCRLSITTSSGTTSEGPSTSPVSSTLARTESSGIGARNGSDTVSRIQIR